VPKILNVLGDEVKTLEDLLEYIDEDDKAAILAAHAQHPSVAVPDEDDTLMVSFMLNRHPLVGGDYYRAYRAAALASNRFGWRTSLANRMVTKEDEPEGRLGFITPAPDEMAKVFFSDVLVIRPVANWRLSNVEQMHANGQKIIADVDDDPWGHEDLSNPDLTPIEDYYTEWLSHADAWLCSTKYLCRRLREHGCRADRVYYAPNLYDPTAMNADPKPGRRLGTRLWLGGRQDGDVAMYDELVFPLLDRLDCSFTHIGAMDDLEIAKVGQKLRRSFGWDTPRLIERPSVTIPEMPAELSRISIGTICMSDNEFNRAKTETHAAELALAGLPLVAASPHELYRNIPGVVALTPTAVERRVKDLIDPEVWHIESKRAKSWARSLAVKHESTYLEALLQAVNAITK
jgi:hypothetical protein